MGDVVRLPVVTRFDIDANVVIEDATAHEFASVTIIGTLENGDEFFASSMASGPEVVWDLERAKLKLLRMVDEGD